MIVGRALLLACTGLVIGIASALALGQAVRGQLFGVALVDPLTLTAVMMVLGTSAALARFVPAWRESIRSSR